VAEEADPRGLGAYFHKFASPAPDLASDLWGARVLVYFPFYVHHPSVEIRSNDT